MASSTLMAPLTPDASSTHWRRYALILALGTFAVGTDAFVIAGVLPSIAASLDVSVAAAGQLVTVFSLTYAITGPILNTLTADWSRRTTLLVALAVFALGNAATALIPSFTPVLLSRVVAAAGASLFTANATAASAYLAGPNHRTRAISLTVLGLTTSLVFGAPLGTFIGSIAGWRMTMWFVTALGLLAGAVIFLCLPDFREGEGSTLSERLAPLRERRVLLGLGRGLAMFTAIYLPYTYVSVVYAPALQDDPQRLGLFLLLFGVAGTAGNLVSGRLADRFGPARSLVAGAVALGIVFLLIPLLRGSLASALIPIMLTGFLAWMLNPPQQHLLIAHAPGRKISLVTSLFQSTIYASAALAGAVGGGMISHGMGNAIPIVSALLAMAFAAATWWQERETRLVGGARR